jgi:hypothetical protein
MIMQNVQMKDAPQDFKAITKQFFTAYDKHNIDGMLALCADGAQGRYLPYGKKNVMPIRGGLEQIWRGLVQAVPDFGVEIDEMIEAEGNTVVVQALLGGAMLTLISYATTLPAKSHAWIVIGITPP